MAFNTASYFFRTVVVVVGTCLGILVGCTGRAADGAAPGRDGRLESKCAESKAPRVRVESPGGKVVSACPVDEDADCLYSATVGKTYMHARLDLNGDSRDDAILRDFSGGYGVHEVVHFLLFAQCADGTYLSVGEDMFSGIDVAVASAPGTWAMLGATRTCFNEETGRIQTRRFHLAFDPERFAYGPPDDNPDLAEYCSAVEMKLPSDKLLD